MLTHPFRSKIMPYRSEGHYILIDAGESSEGSYDDDDLKLCRTGSVGSSGKFAGLKTERATQA
jgi:hypothetical protein